MAAKMNKMLRRAMHQALIGESKHAPKHKKTRGRNVKRRKVRDAVK